MIAIISMAVRERESNVCVLAIPEGGITCDDMQWDEPVALDIISKCGNNFLPSLLASKIRDSSKLLTTIQQCPSQSEPTPMYTMLLHWVWYFYEAPMGQTSCQLTQCCVMQHKIGLSFRNRKKIFRGHDFNFKI